MVAIPASQTVSVIPSVIGGGGAALDLVGLILTQNPRVPIGTVPSFPDQPTTAAFFGSGSQEAALAANYFLGFDGSTVKPGALLFSRYAATPAAAWLGGANISGLSLAALQAISGTLVVTVDGVVKTAAALNLSTATSFATAATIIGTALGLTSLPGATFTGVIAASILTVSALTGTVAPGQVISGGAITLGTFIVNQLTGVTGGVGTYTVSGTVTQASTAVTAVYPPVTYDSQSGAFRIYSSTTGATSTLSFASGTTADNLLLTQGAGAVLSQGAGISTPAAAMDAVAAITQDWASFMTAFEPVTADKVAFSQWTNNQGNQYGFVAWTSNAAATIVPDTTTAGALIQIAGYSGTELIYDPVNGAALAAFKMGETASIDFDATNGRTTAKFRSQSGLIPGVTNGLISKNLEANGYNFYGDNSTRKQDFIYYANGSMTGPFKWSDSYYNQIWMNNAFQVAIESVLTVVKSIPYTPGYALLDAAMLDPIVAAVNFGAIRANVSLSTAQAAEVNFAAGLKIDDVLSSRGWYLQIKDPTAQVRAARGSPVMSFWYMDGQSIQRIVLSSVEVM